MGICQDGLGGLAAEAHPYVQSATSSCNKLCANTFRAPFVEAAALRILSALSAVLDGK